MLTLTDIERAVQGENMTISGGNVDMNNIKRNMSISGQFTSPRQIQDIVLRGGNGAIVKLKDIANVQDTYEEPKSYARYDGKNVISLNVIKKRRSKPYHCERRNQTYYPRIATNDLSKRVKNRYHRRPINTDADDS